MAGITNSPFRRLMKRHGNPLVISELVSANGIQYASKKTFDLLHFHEEERPVGLQIFGEDEERLCFAAREIERRGADFVDLNLGCPVPKVVKSGAGSAMCRNPIQLGKILQAMVKSVKIPVTIKIRTGWDATTRNALEVVQAAQDAGVAWVAVHGRTRAQAYTGLADWDFIGELKARSRFCIIGNGDILTPETALKRYLEYGVDAVMIGRGALRNPFIFEQCEDLYLKHRHGEALSLDQSTQSRVDQQKVVALVQEQRLLLEERIWGHFSEAMAEDRPMDQGAGTHPTAEKLISPESRDRVLHSAMIHARKFLAWYSAGYPGSGDFRKKVFTIVEPDALWDEACAFFSRETSHRDYAFMQEGFLQGGHG